MRFGAEGSTDKLIYRRLPGQFPGGRSNYLSIRFPFTTRRKWWVF